MGYTTQNGRYADVESIKLNPLEGQLTQDGYSPVIELGDRRILRLELDVSAVSDSDTLDVEIQCSADGKTGWYPVGSFTQATDVTNERQVVMLDRFVRAFFNVGGSGVAIDCTLVGEAA